MEIILGLVILVLIGVVIWLGLRIRTFDQAYGTFFRDGDPRPVMKALNNFSDRVIRHEQQIASMQDSLDKLHILAEHGQSRIGFIRFNPFSDTGGDQSFCLAVLDTHGDGWVLSSIHARTGTRIYAKQVLSGRSPHNLSDEESTAVTKALKQNPYHDHPDTHGKK